MVSIIVPVYNIEKYLPHCVESLLGQSYRDLQILLVDDGSQDGSGALCDSYGARDTRIQVIHKKNGGLSSARNAGLDVAAGEWILFVDGDDYLVPDGVERLLAVAEPDADFVQFHYHETEDVSWLPEKGQADNKEIRTGVKEMFYRLYAMGGVAASSCTKLFASRLFDELRFQEGILHEDEELINRLLPKCEKVIYTDLVLYGYVTRGESIVHSAFRRKQMDVFSVMEKRILVLEQLGMTDLVKQTHERLFQTAAWQYCLAKSGGLEQEAKELKAWLQRLAKIPGLALTGQYMLLYRLMKGCPSVAPNLYYILRRICGKS